MTVRELIEWLEMMPQETEVVSTTDDGEDILIDTVFHDAVEDVVYVL